MENKFKIHTLKTDPEPFESVLLGLKKFEIRFDDRGFEVSDELYLQETKYTGTEINNGAELIYTGRVTIRAVSHILRGPIYGLLNGWVIMSFI